MKQLLLFATLSASLWCHAQVPRWKWVYDATDSQTEEVLQAPDGGYFVLGTLHPNDENNDVWLIKLDAWGNVQWDIPYFDPGAEKVYSGAVLEDGGLIHAGCSYEWDWDLLAYTNRRGYLMKLEPYGDIIWTKT